MRQNKKYSIIALAAIAVVSVGIFSITLNVEDDVQAKPQKAGMLIMHSYLTTDIEGMREHSTNIVEGKIVDKYQIIQYRDIDGNYVDVESGKVAETQPYIVYQMQGTDILNQESKTTIYNFKTFGGETENIIVETMVPEFNVGDNVLVFLTEKYDGENHEIMSGEFGIYKITNDKATNANSEVSVSELRNSLN